METADLVGMARAAERQYVETVEQWRQALGLSHVGLTRRLGGDKSEWSRIRRGERAPSGLFHARVSAQAAEPWASAIREAWRRAQDAAHVALEARLKAAAAA